MYSCSDFLRSPHDLDVLEVLLGSSYWTVPKQGLSEAVYGRRMDGLWTTRGQGTSPQLASLITIDSCRVENLARNSRAKLWDSPYRSPALLPEWRCDLCARAEAGEALCMSEGQSCSEALGLVLT